MSVRSVLIAAFIFQVLSFPLSSIAGGDVLRVHLPDQPINGVEEYTFETIWSQPAEAEDFLLGQMVDAAIDPEGNICVLDFRQKNLLIFTPEGQYLRTIGREGEGPGEMSDARKIFQIDGRFGILQSFPAAIVWLNADGSPGGKVTLGENDLEGGSFVAAAHAMQAGPSIYVWANQTEFTEDGPQYNECIHRLESDGSLGPALYEEPEHPNARTDHGIDEGKVYDTWLRRWTADNNGGLWVAPTRDEFVLKHWTAQGDQDLELRRKYEPVLRCEAGRDNIRVWFKRRGWDENEIKVGKKAPVVDRVRLADNGDIWVKLDQGGTPPGKDPEIVYDVINSKGQYLRQIRIQGMAEVTGRRMLNDSTSLAFIDESDEEEAQLLLQKMVRR